MSLILNENLEELSYYKEGLNLLLGTFLAEGGSRKVYTCALNPELVVKLAPFDPYSNRQESFIWNEAMWKPDVYKWLAPVVAISENGRILIQKRTTLLDHSKYPKKLPAFLADTKYANYGMLDGKFVCHDYNITRICDVGLSTKLVKVEWWGK